MKSLKTIRIFILLGIATYLAGSMSPLLAQEIHRNGFKNHFRILHHQRLNTLRFQYRNAEELTTSDEPSAPPANISFDAYGKQFDMDLESNEKLLDNLPKDQRKRIKQSMQLYKGRINGAKGSWVRINRTGNRITGAFWDGQELYIMDNSDKVSTNMDNAGTAGASVKPYNLVYKLSDTQETASCAVEAQPASSLSGLVSELQTQAQALAQANRKLDVAIVADAEFTQANISNPQAAVIDRMNVVDGIYSEQVGIHLNIAEVRALSSNGGMSSTSPSSLLTQFASYTTSSGFNNPGIAHLFTGRDLDGSTVGIAYLGVLCRKDVGVGLSQTTGSGIAGALTVAHEMGHNFGAPHDTQAGSACATAPSTFIMNPVLNGSTQFSDCSLQQMAPKISAAACITANTPTTTPTADIRPVIPVNPIGVTVGNNFNFNIEVRNSGNTLALGSTAKITLPTGLTLNNVTSTLGQCQTSGQTVNCNVGNLAANSTATIAMNLKAGNIAGNLKSTVQVAATNDSNTTNNSVSVGINIAEIPPVTSTPGVIFQSDFNANNGGFVYVDDTFRGTKQPFYASGSRTVNAGDGKLEVALGGIDSIAIKGMSGGWRRSFTLTKPQTVSLSFEFKVDQTSHYESNEWSDGLLALDGKLIGLNGGDFLARVVGDGEGGATIKSSGKYRVTITRGILAAGVHTVTLGGYNNQKTSDTESTRISFDNVKLVTKP